MCCVGRGLCERLITRPEESYRLCVCVCLSACDLETSTTIRSRLKLGRCATKKKSPLIYSIRYETRKLKIPNWMLRIFRIYSALNVVWMQLWFVYLFPKYSIWNCHILGVPTSCLYIIIVSGSGDNTMILTSWSRVLLEKLTGFAANQEIPRILWNPKVHYWTIQWYNT